MTLKKSPIITSYFIGNTALEHVDTIRDLGVILDKKLTFRPHIESSVKKANRALGLLIRTFQKPKTGRHLNLSAARVSYYAHVRSVLEYGSVVWSGAAKTHTDRLERVRHRFLTWLNRCSPQPASCQSLDYAALLRHFRMCPLSSRRVQHDILFIRNVFRRRIDSAFLLGSFTPSAPVRIGRHCHSSMCPTLASAQLETGFSRERLV